MNLASTKEDFRYIMLGVICYGMVYLMFRVWSELPGKIMLYSAAIVVALAFLAQMEYAPFWLYELSGFNIAGVFGYFRIWASLVATVGLVLMVFVFYKFDDDGY